MIIKNTYSTVDPIERSARQAAICRRCLLLPARRGEADGCHLCASVHR